MLVRASVIRQGQYRTALAAADLVLAQYPDDADAMVKKATAAYALMTTEYASRYGIRGNWAILFSVSLGCWLAFDRSLGELYAVKQLSLRQGR
ncbi:MAG: hypothetical protein ACPGO3_14480 [Magnetospiraceae bacterium]